MRWGWVPRLFATLCLSGLLSATVALTAPDAVAVDGPLVYGINPFGNDATSKGLRPFNAANGLNATGFVITNAGGPVTGAVEGGNGLADDPTSTSVYAILKITGQAKRVLSTINLSNGQATTIGSTGLQIAAITFAADGTLYAVTGSGDTTCAACLYTLNKTTASPTLVMELTNVNGGQAIAFNSDDGLIYHATGNFDTAPQDFVFEKVNPLTQAITDIGYLGSIPQEVFGMGYDATNDRFIVTDFDQDVWSLTPTGDATLLSSTDDWLRGLIVSADPVPPNAPPTAVDDEAIATRDGPPVNVRVLSNDTDPEDNPITTIDSFTQPTNGTVHQNGSELVYQPDGDYCNDGAATDDFTYTLTGNSTATVAVTVECLHLTVYGFTESGDLATFDRSAGAILSGEQLTVAGGPVPGTGAKGRGLAVAPKTSQVFATVEMQPSNDEALATLDLATGQVRTIRKTPQQFDALTFGSDGTLYGVTDNENPCSACLYKFNKRTGGRTLLSDDLSGDNDVHAIAYNPTDGMIYHATGLILEKIDPKQKFAVSTVEYNGQQPSIARGLGFDATNGNFVLTDVDSKVWTVTPTGTTTLLSSTDGDFAGLIVGTWRKIVLKYSARQRLFTGALTSLAGACIDGRSVTIFKKKRGPDAVIGQVVTVTDGAYELQRRARPGTYYASAEAEIVTPFADCAAVLSRSVFVR